MKKDITRWEQRRPHAGVCPTEKATRSSVVISAEAAEVMGIRYAGHVTEQDGATGATQTADSCPVQPAEVRLSSLWAGSTMKKEEVRPPVPALQNHTRQIPIRQFGTLHIHGEATDRGLTATGIRTRTGIISPS